jgi:hypothetical protein
MRPDTESVKWLFDPVTARRNRRGDRTLMINPGKQPQFPSLSAEYAVSATAKSGIGRD